MGAIHVKVVRWQTAVTPTTSMGFGFKDCVGSGSTFPCTKLLGRDPLYVKKTPPINLGGVLFYVREAKPRLEEV